MIETSPFPCRTLIDCAVYSSAIGLNTWVYEGDVKSCYLGTLTHVVLAESAGSGITAGVPSNLPIAREIQTHLQYCSVLLM